MTCYVILGVPIFLVLVLISQYKHVASKLYPFPVNFINPARSIILIFYSDFFLLFNLI